MKNTELSKKNKILNAEKSKIQSELDNEKEKFLKLESKFRELSNTVKNLNSKIEFLSTHKHTNIEMLSHIKKNEAQIQKLLFERKNDHKRLVLYKNKIEKITNKKKQRELRKNYTSAGL